MEKMSKAFKKYNIWQNALFVHVSNTTFVSLWINLNYYRKLSENYDNDAFYIWCEILDPID